MSAVWRAEVAGGVRARFFEAVGAAVGLPDRAIGRRRGATTRRIGRGCSSGWRRSGRRSCVRVWTRWVFPGLTGGGGSTSRASSGTSRSRLPRESEHALSGVSLSWRCSRLPKPRGSSAPKSRQAPDAAGFSEGESSRENHQEWKEAERDEPEAAMARFVGMRRIDAVVGKRLPDERNVNEQENEGG